MTNEEKGLIPLDTPDLTVEDIADCVRFHGFDETAHYNSEETKK